MSELSVVSRVAAHLTWDYDASDATASSLVEHARDNAWHPHGDIDWNVDVPFGAPLPDDSGFAMASFEASPLRPFGRGMWDRFRWELQAWMVSQFLHGEQGALVATARLAEVLPTIDAKRCAAVQVADEAQHLEVFRRYLREHVPEPYEVSPPLVRLLEDSLGDGAWDIAALGLQLVIEPLALAAFRVADGTFHDPLIRQICRLVARDEARHVSFGVVMLKARYAELSDREREHRETFVIEAARLMRRRFLLEEIWDRMGIDREAGCRFAHEDPLMTSYRRTLFANVVSALARVGLMTPRVRTELDAMGLVTCVPAR